MKKNKTYWKKKADTEWKRVVKARDLHACRYCQRTDKQLHAHHIIGRRITHLRFNLWNGITLCASHHVFDKFSAHENTVGFNEWLRDEIGEDIFDGLKVSASMERKMPFDYYESEYKRLKAMKEIT